MIHDSRPRVALLDTEALAHLYVVTRATIRRWARIDDWTPYGPANRRLWDLSAADASWRRRHPREVARIERAAAEGRDDVDELGGWLTPDE